MDLATADAYVHGEVSAAVETVWRLAALASGSPGPMYLIYRPTSDAGAAGELGISRDAAPLPDGWHLAEAQRVPLNVERAYLYRWIAERARRLPILPSPAGAS